MRLTILLTLFIGLILLTTTSASYFYLLDTEPSCFLEDVPEDTAILLKYANLDMEQLSIGVGNNPQLIRVTVSDPNSRSVVTQDCQKKGQLAFTSRISGDYKICVEVINSPRNGRQYKFGLKVTSAVETNDYSQLAKQEHFSAIQVEIGVKLRDRIAMQQQELTYLRTIETKTRDHTEVVHDHIVYFCIGQTVIILAGALFQIFKLRRFFKAKQLTQ